MAYKKPQIIAKSEAQQSYVAACQTKDVVVTVCSTGNKRCLCGPLN